MQMLNKTKKVSTPARFNLVQSSVKNFKRDYASDNTLKGYINDIEQFFGFHVNKSDLNTLTVKDVEITTKDVICFKNHLKDKGNAASTINRKISALTNLYRQFELDGVTKCYNAFQLLKSEKSTERSWDAFTSREIKTIIKNIEKEKMKDYLQFKWLITIAVDTAMRKSPLTSLTWKQMVVDEDNHRVNFNQLEKGNKDNNRGISIQLYKNMLEDLSPSEDDILVFPSCTDKRIRNLMIKIKKWLKVDNETRKISFHSFKTTALNLNYMKYKDIKMAQKVGGHKNVATTDRYLSSFEKPMLGTFSETKVDTDLYVKIDSEIVLKAIDNLDDQVKSLINDEIQRLVNQQAKVGKV